MSLINTAFLHCLPSKLPPSLVQCPKEVLQPGGGKHWPQAFCKQMNTWKYRSFATLLSTPLPLTLFHEIQSPGLPLKVKYKLRTITKVWKKVKVGLKSQDQKKVVMSNFHLRCLWIATSVRPRASMNEPQALLHKLCNLGGEMYT